MGHEYLPELQGTINLGRFGGMSDPTPTFVSKSKPPSKRTLAITDAEAAMGTPELGPAAEPEIASELDHSVQCDLCGTWRNVVPTQFHFFKRPKARFCCRHAGEEC